MGQMLSANASKSAAEVSVNSIALGLQRSIKKRRRPQTGGPFAPERRVEKMKECFKADSIENILVILYTASVCLSPLGPIVHYVLWALCLVLMTVGRVKYHIPFRPKNLDRTGKIVLGCWLALSLWGVAAGLLTFHDVDSYGRNVTIFVEVVLGMYFAVRFLVRETSRRKMLRFFVWASVLILFGNLLRELGFLGYFPNRSLENGNNLGLLGVLLLPPLVCYAFWCARRLVWRLLIVVPSCLVVFLSFSSGAWMAAAIGGCSLLYWAFRFKKIGILFLASGAVVLVLACVAINARSEGRLWKKIAAEYRQVTSMRDMGTFTTYRNEIWSASTYLIRKRPVTGWGGENFLHLYHELFRTKAGELGLKHQANGMHPHSTFLNVVYLAGIPGLAFFLAAYALSLRKAFRLAQTERECFFPWGVALFVLLLAVLAYALTGDVLMGRRDTSVMFWCFWGILLILPERSSSCEES